MGIMAFQIVRNVNAMIMAQMFAIKLMDLANASLDMVDTSAVIAQDIMYLPRYVVKDFFGQLAVKKKLSKMEKLLLNMIILADAFHGLIIDLDFLQYQNYKNISCF